MRIFLAGGTGVIGSRLLPALVAAGHEVVATTRREDRLALLEGLGARGLLLDVYDAERVAAALAEATPDLALHQLTDLRRGDRDANARLRREGTANLVAGAEAAGVDRIVVQSITWLFPDGDAPATEDDLVVPGTPVDVMEGLVRRLAHTTVLRYGTLYGPGTSAGPTAPTTSSTTSPRRQPSGYRSTRPASGHPPRRRRRSRRASPSAAPSPTRRPGRRAGGPLIRAGARVSQPPPSPAPRARSVHQ